MPYRRTGTIASLTPLHGNGNRHVETPLLLRSLNRIVEDVLSASPPHVAGLCPTLV